jgi:hypothetical protein
MKRSVVVAGACLGLLLLGADIAEGAGKETKRKLPPDQALKRKIDHHTAKGSLMAVLTDFASQAGVTIRVDWKALEETGVTGKAPVAVSLENVTYRQLLEVILSRAGRKGHPLGWRIDSGDVVISTHRRILLMEEGARHKIANLTTKKTPGSRAGTRLLTLPRNVLPGVNFDKLPFRDTLTFFQTAIGENFHVNWRALQQEGIDPETPITLNVRRVSVATAMDLVLDQVNADRDKLTSVYWVIDRGVLLISTGNALNKRLITRVVDAGGALLVQPDSKGPRIDLEAYSQNTPSGTSGRQTDTLFDDEDNTSRAGESDSYYEQKRKHTEKVLETIKTMIGTDMWEPEGRGSIRVLNNKIVITQTLLGFKLLESALR